MKTSLIFLATATAAAILLSTLVGLSAGAFVTLTTLSIIAILAVDLDLTTSEKRPALAQSQAVTAHRGSAERHPLAS